jgi:hypothetical protein
MVVKNKVKDNVKYFMHIEIGEAFIHNTDVYIKITNHIDEENQVEANSVNLRTGETEWFAPYTSVLKIKAIIEIEEN